MKPNTSTRRDSRQEEGNAGALGEPMRGAVLGGDVSRSRSPGIHLAAWKALGMEGSYERFSVDAAGFRRLVRALGAQGYRYLNVTIPHKKAAADLADRASPLVKAVAAANTLVFRRTRAGVEIRAENTDGYGLIEALGELGARPAAGDAVVLLGAGGAAAGGLAALLATGAVVRIVARRPQLAQALRRRLPVRARSRVIVAPWTAADLAAQLEGAKAVISSVPADVFAAPDATAGLEAISRKTAVLEMAYGDETPLKRFVMQRTRWYQDGLPMLVHQAARAVELVTGSLPPTAPLMRAARRPVTPSTEAAPLDHGGGDRANGVAKRGARV